jgi:hypothetical protein
MYLSSAQGVFFALGWVACLPPSIPPLSWVTLTWATLRQMLQLSGGFVGFCTCMLFNQRTV